MKIYDIIAESQQLNEAGYLFGVYLNRAIPKGIQAIEHVMKWFAEKLVGKPKAIDDLAEGWAVLAEKTGMSSDEAIRIGSRQAKAAGHADDVIEAAARRAEELIQKAANTPWAKLSNPNSAFNFWYGTRAAEVNKWLMAYGILQPVAECAYEIFKLYKMREEGHPELQDLNKLSWGVQWHIDQCVKQVASLIAGNFLLKKLVTNWVPGVAYNLWPVGKLFQALDPIYNKLPPAATAAFKVWMMTDDGREALAKYLVGEAMIPGTEWKAPGGKYWQKVIDILSGLAKTGYDHVLRWTGHGDLAKPLPDPNANTDKPASTNRLYGPRRHDMGTGELLK